MKQQFHILNGDALKNRFPDTFGKNIIVARECLMDGDVSGNTLNEFYANRAKFIGDYFGKIESSDYYSVTVAEFEKIGDIPENSEVNLWFEDDLFCQVNFWFVVYLINQNNRNHSIYLVRPTIGNEYNFGNLSDKALIIAYRKRILLTETDLKNIEKLWNYYRVDNFAELKKLANDLSYKFSFIKPAVNAHIARIPGNGQPGKPVQTLLKIINELDTTSFEPVFREFCKREAIYGYGDLQVKKMLNELNKNQNNE